MASTRDRIRRQVHETPGVHFSRVERELDLATGQVQYHLRRLVRDGELVPEEVGGRTHYFAPTFDPWERRTVAYHVDNLAADDVIRRDTAGAIGVALVEPERTVTLLETVSPSLPERVVDRFVRTVDRLLDG